MTQASALSASHPPLPRPVGRRIGLFGGSFNPAHEGHLHVSTMALTALGLDEVWWMVSPQNPLKSTNGMAPLADRLASARERATHPRLRVTDIETHLTTRFTADTITTLQNLYPQIEFVWLMGADNLIQFTRWESWTHIARSLPVAVYPRPGYSLKARCSLAAQWYGERRIAPEVFKRNPHPTPPALIFLSGPEHPASATAIRAQTRKS